MKTKMPGHLAAALLCTLMWGCSAGRRAATELDCVAQSLDRYGFASISSPVLTGPSDAFKIDLDKPASYFFDKASESQGSARGFDALAIDTQLQIRVNLEQTLATVAQFARAGSIAEFHDLKGKAALQRDQLKSLVGVAASQPANSPLSGFSDDPRVAAAIGLLDTYANQPEPDPDALPGFKATTQPTANKPPFSAADRTALTAVGQFTPGISLPTTTGQISARDALLIAAGDVLTQSLLRWFVQPEGNKLGDYELFFCPVVISVQPGYETRNGYQADISVSVDLARVADDKLEFLSARFGAASPPIQIAGVYPLIDAQVLDLVSSRRRLYAMAFQLAMVGFGSEANFFLDYARRLEKDAATRSVLTVATAYTAGPNTFGFRVEPKFLAIKNLGEVEAKPYQAGSVLESKSFPAMAVLLVHRSFLRSREEVKFGKNADRAGRDDITEDGVAWNQQLVASGGAASALAPPEAKTAPDKKADEKYDYLVLRTSMRWTPIDGGGWFGPRRYTEVESWRRAEALDNAATWTTGRQSGLFAWCFPKVPHDGYQRDQLSSRVLALRQAALDSQALVRVYHRGPSRKIEADAQEFYGWLDQYTVLTIRGTGFGGGNVKFVTIGGRPCEFAVVDDHCLLILVPPWATPGTTPPKMGEEFARAVATAGASGNSPVLSAESASLAPEDVVLATRPATSAQSYDCKKPLLPSERDRLAELTKRSNTKDAKLTDDEKKEWNSLRDHEFCWDAYVTGLAAHSQEIVIAAGVLGRNGTSREQIAAGKVSFTRRISSSSSGGAGAKEAGIKISRNAAGDITGVDTSGGAANGSELLKIVLDALKGTETTSISVMNDDGIKVNAGPTSIRTGTDTLEKVDVHTASQPASK